MLYIRQTEKLYKEIFTTASNIVSIYLGIIGILIINLFQRTKTKTQAVKLLQNIFN